MTQKMRSMERSVRALKREKEALKYLGMDTTEIQAKISRKTREYNEFCGMCGVNPKASRLRYECGTSDLKKTEAWKKYSSIKEVEKADGYRIGNNKVDLDYINSEEYRDKFKAFSKDEELNECLYKAAKEILVHRNGSDIEDMYLIYKNNHTVEGMQRKGTIPLEVEYNDSLRNAIANNPQYSLIAMHNYPTNIMPDGSDYVSSGYRRYYQGIILCYNGKVYTYRVGNRIFTAGLLDKRIDKYTKMPYDMSYEEAHETVLNEMSEEYGLEWSELK